MLSLGRRRVSSSAAERLHDPDWFEGVCRRHPGKIVAGIDAKQGRVATEGWLKVSEVSALDLARRLADWPLAAIVYTDISRDGMMAGPNIDGLAEMAGRRRGADHRLRRRDHIGRCPPPGRAEAGRLHRRPSDL